MNSEVSLDVNDKAIALDSFVKGLIDSTIIGILIVLEGVSEIHGVDLKIDSDGVSIQVNGEQITLNPFVGNTIRNTVCGMISSFEGVERIDTARIRINRRAPERKR